MAPTIKAVVFKTPCLKATFAFFTTILGIVVKESSVTHFVIHSKGLRLLFVEADKGFEIEFYVSKGLDRITKNNKALLKFEKQGRLTVCEDPNGIKVIVTGDDKALRVERKKEAAKQKSE